MAKSSKSNSAGKGLKAPFVPKDWVSGFDVYKYSKAAVKINLDSVISLLILSLLAGGISSIVFKDNSGGGLLSFIVQSFVLAASAYVYVACVKGKKVEINDAANVGFKYLLSMIALNFLVIVSLAVSILLLLIPFFFVFPRLLIAQYYLVNEKMGVIESYKASWDSMRGHSGKAWGIVGVSILIGLLAITIIGIPFAIYMWVMYSASTAVLYEYVRKN